MRNFVRGQPGLIGAVASRLSGSSDIYQWSGHLPINSINFVTCHDGFTLNDFVSYNEKHNLANGENNNDGANDNNSWNCGVEGPTDDLGIERFRNQQVKNFAMLLLLSQGVPMITAGDEMRRTQGGNNNAYCQDSEISWVDWALAEKHADVVRFFRELIALRRKHSLLRRRQFFTGERNARGFPDISWHDAQLNPPAWNDPETRQLAVTWGGPDDDLDLHMMMNMGEGVAAFRLPVALGHVWKRVADTALQAPDDIVARGKGVTIEGDQYLVNGHSIVLLASAPV